MSERKKNIDYEAGHKRETRKSYQTFLEELMSDPSAEDTSGSAAEASDDASVRRSKRTPVPKRGFKLIDDYDSKEHPGKKKFKGADESNEQRAKYEKDPEEESKELSSEGDIVNEEIKSENEEVKKINDKVEQIVEANITDDEPGGSGSPAPRKSGRARKAKTFEDSIMPEIKSRCKKAPELATSDLSDAESEILRKKVLLKLTANTPISVKEETIIGKDNVEYLYRNVFVTEILDSKRKRTCRLSKDSESKDESDKSTKGSDTTKDKDSQDKDSKDSTKDVNKDSPNADIKRKKGEKKLKTTPDKSAKASPKSTNINSSSEITDIKEKKRKSVDKEKDVVSDKTEFKKSNELVETSSKKTVESESEPKRKRSSVDKQDSRKSNEPKRTSIELYEGSDNTKQKLSVPPDDEIKPNIDIIKKKEKEKDVEKLDTRLKKHDEKKPKSEVKKTVKFAEKEEIKVFEKDVEYDEKPPKRKCSDKRAPEEKLALQFNTEQVVPTLADSVKSRRKEKEKKPSTDHVEHPSPEPLDKQSASPVNQESRKNKRKTPKDESSTTSSKAEAKEQKSPSKSDKSKSTKEKDPEKTLKESKKMAKATDSNEKIEERDQSPKKDVSKHSSSKKKLSPSSKKEKSSESIREQLIENLEPVPPKKKKSKAKQESVSIIDSEISNNVIKEEHEEAAPIVLTFKSSDITNISPPKKKEPKSHTYDKTSTKLSKKSEIKKSKKQNKKKTKKLIVSFKNNQSFQPKKKKSLEKEEPVDIPESPAPSSLDTSSDTSKQEQITPEKIMLDPPPIFLDPVPETLLDTPPDDDEEVKHKKKSKKKSKTKLKKHQKIVNVETFTVADQTVVKVKKKKIYKNRNGEKVLIRLIKNHCNKNGDIVKTETIVVDNDAPPIEEEKEKLNSTSPETPKSFGFAPFDRTPVKTEMKEVESKTPEKATHEKKVIPEKVIAGKTSATKEAKLKKMGEKKVSATKGPKLKKMGEKKVLAKKNSEKVVHNEMEPDMFAEKKIKEDSPEYSPRLNNDVPNHTTAKRKSKFKHSSDSKSNFKSSEKRPIFKKSQKIMKKPLSRPANKNVTVGGKVVGKTTKGMKKTGGDNVEPPPVNKTIVKSNVFEPIAPELPSVPVTEPKNVYNFFCRKYRPIVVQQFPKADFSEISRRLAALWKTLSETERQDQRDKFEELHSVSQQKLSKLGRLSPTMWSESDLKFIKKNISENDSYTDVFSIPKYPVKRLSPIDMAAHLSLLGDSLNVISGALQQQSSMTVHGAMSVLLDSILSALAPLIFFTSHIPEMKAIDDSQQARILDNLAYILPGL